MLLIGRLGPYLRCSSLPNLFSCSLIVRRDICTLIIPAAPSVNKLSQLVLRGAVSILIYWGAGPLFWLTGIRLLITGFSSLSLVSVDFLTSDLAANIVKRVRGNLAALVAVIICSLWLPCLYLLFIPLLNFVPSTLIVCLPSPLIRLVFSLAGV